MCYVPIPVFAFFKDCRTLKEYMKWLGIGGLLIRSGEGVLPRGKGGLARLNKSEGVKDGVVKSPCLFAWKRMEGRRRRIEEIYRIINGRIC